MQRFLQQVSEDLLRRSGAWRGLSLPARHVGEYLRGKARQVEESLGEIGGSFAFRTGQRPTR
jgi:hypothetical protein